MSVIAGKVWGEKGSALRRCVQALLARGGGAAKKGKKTLIVQKRCRGKKANVPRFQKTLCGRLEDEVVEGQEGKASEAGEGPQKERIINGSEGKK